MFELYFHLNINIFLYISEKKKMFTNFWLIKFDLC
jgi:hypothetical protein